MQVLVTQVENQQSTLHQKLFRGGSLMYGLVVYKDRDYGSE